MTRERRSTLRGNVGGRFEVRERLAENEAGVVYLARDSRRGEDVELRVLHAGPNAAAVIEEARRIAQHHPACLPAVLEVNDRPGAQYIVAEHVTGMTLAARLARAGRTGDLSLDDAISIASEIGRALLVIQRLAIEHDPLSAEHVVFGPERRIVLLDQGAIRGERAAPAGGLDAAGATTMRARDSYAFGALIFELATGAVPRPWEPIVAQLGRFPETHAALRAPIAALVDVEDGRAPPSLDEIVAMLHHARSSLRPLSIIIAEYDRGARSLLAQVLRQISPGAALRFCGDGRSLLGLVAAEPADAVFYDPEVVRLDAADLVDAVREARPTATICATRAMRDERGLEIESIEIGRHGSKAELVDALRAILGRRRTERAPQRVTRPLVPVPRLPAPVAVPRANVSPGMVVAGRYRVEECLGAGGMGSVFAVRHLELGKRFALKLMHPAMREVPEARRRFLEEARLASQISHPSVVSISDVGEDDVIGPFLVMELLSGESLGRSSGRMSLRKTCETLGQLADALDALHRGGIVHGDVKPDNIMLVEESSGPRRRTIARLIDFGLAQRVAATGERDVVGGTPEYMSPECARGAPPSIAADLYALGVVAYELLAGSVPFSGRSEDVLDAQVVADPPPMTPQRGQPIDEAIVVLVARAMHKDPLRRHASAATFRYELNACMEMLGMTPRRARSDRGDAGARLFDQSRLAQAIVTRDGVVDLANDAFRALAPDITQLVMNKSTLADKVARAHALGAPIASTARHADQALVLMIAPLGDGAHIVVSAVPHAGSAS